MNSILSQQHMRCFNSQLLHEMIPQFDGNALVPVFWSVVRSDGDVTNVAVYLAWIRRPVQRRHGHILYHGMVK